MSSNDECNDTTITTPTLTSTATATPNRPSADRTLTSDNRSRTLHKKKSSTDLRDEFYRAGGHEPVRTKSESFESDRNIIIETNKIS
ncbi:hypothetical protein E1B28_007368 [Marasmius oreades]|uniref:Uncharacterized protein n=1 Tax=Marasmius oreades TaxID=181124 RepID=A0A9P7S1F8_9AGAR|nr:uncharacterized protein E1B28_007368 [Marasmius oreades]KAG7093714.1 hypothetical protein E1B28_007368 [Marasmius oreades]